MAISLVKGQKISLEKESGGGLSKVVMGLGWDPVKKKGLFFSKPVEIDLDASCILFDEKKTPVDFVWFNQLRSRDGSITHTGDNLTGEGEGDDEQIIVDLAKVPGHVKYLVFTVNSFRGQTFNQVQNAYCRLVDERNQKELARYTLSGGGDHTAMIMAKVYRHQNEWKMHALGDPAQGRVVEQLIADAVKIL
ncbi:MAG: TerD family protein [Deltaproteobacteria bacterium]|jgi:tellurium resistance protein TerZ|nr:TerD family protein [Deltaproteobacteria bacterium]